MYRQPILSICVSLLSFVPLSGQGMTLAGSGYSTPQIRVAPGQIVTLFVANTKSVAVNQRATSMPLPNSLAGFSVAIRQLGTVNATLPTGMLSVQQGSICGTAAGATGCSLTAITVQIPFEMVLQEEPSLPTELLVNDNGVQSEPFLVTADQDRVHVLTTCETQGSLSDGSSSSFQPCSGLVTHADGSLISPRSPAKAGEVVVIFAFGLGPTSPQLQTGVASPTPAPVLANKDLTLGFDFRPNATPSRPYVSPLATAQQPMFAGLTPGRVGLYQINVRLPDAFAPVPACSGSTPAPTSALVQSNLTIDIGGINSYDGAAICVQPQQ
jgi:uncharacterized protein (TIGR03437 family)